jgi:lysophospholipase L1-like esterase
VLLHLLFTLFSNKIELCRGDHLKPGPTYCSLLGVATIVVIVGYALASSSIKQIGAIVLIATIFSTPVLFIKPTKRTIVIRNMKRFSLELFVFMSIFFMAGEIALRIWFWNGASFSSHGGPIVKRFERGFKFNHFDGPSRGPEYSSDNRLNSVRVLVQGDSITWGQGVQREEELFTTRLLSLLRQDILDTEMAVLACPGREIDDHLVQIAKWGKEIDPEIIIYQFYINDVELNKNRPRATFRIWRRVFFHKILLSHSYLWFFLDYNLNQWLPSKNIPSYSDYMLSSFESDNDEWKRSMSVFQAWAREAKRLTPKVLIILYPHLNRQCRPELQTIYNWFGDLCKEQGFEVLDLWQTFGDLQGDLNRIRATKYDGHPSAEVHKRIADSIYKRLLQNRWTDVGKESMSSF